MKRRLFMFYIMLFCFVIAGCENKNENKFNFNIDKEGNYTGFDKLTDYNNAKEAVADGCYVKEEDDFKGTEHWEEFLDKASRGEEIQLRTVILSAGKKNEYIDLFYHNELYYVFKSETDDLTVKGYKYLLELEESKAVDNKIAYAVILSNDDSLTFTDIINDLTSSKKIVIGEIYKLIFMGIKSV